ncbi:MAG: phosphoribosylformylglycinamidine synthase subunit PurQ [Bacteroidetes bacterium]|nr:phosphoribosylformylglycinamidine synthase subunit PurQ [Bacteroidota bacterium]
MRVGVIQFPGSNCDHDALHAWGTVTGQTARLIWHKDSDLGDVDLVFLPGGFSYGDYLRCGAIAKYSPVMKEVVRFASKGGLVAGVCNGFQILVESGLLPGVLLPNTSLKFICRHVNLKVSNANTRFSSSYQPGQIIRVPIAHGEGNYFAQDDVLAGLQDNRQIVFQYCDADGSINEEGNPNGSALNIAGIVNREGNVFGMMPHPERSVETNVGGTDGLGFLQSIIRSLETRPV